MTTTSGSLHTVVYSSTATAPMDDAALADLLVESRRSNIDRDLTGMLLYRDGRFIQVLEGSEANVRDVLSKIEADPRHTDMRVLLADSPESRRFSEWSMGYQAISAPREERPEGYRSTFDDLEDDSDTDNVRRALSELTLWFRVRAGRNGA